MVKMYFILSTLVVVSSCRSVNARDTASYSHLTASYDVEASRPVVTTSSLSHLFHSLNKPAIDNVQHQAAVRDEGKLDENAKYLNSNEASKIIEDERTSGSEQRLYYFHKPHEGGTPSQTQFTVRIEPSVTMRRPYTVLRPPHIGISIAAPEKHETADQPLQPAFVVYQWNNEDNTWKSDNEVGTYTEHNPQVEYQNGLQPRESRLVDDNYLAILINEDEQPVLTNQGFNEENTEIWDTNPEKNENEPIELQNEYTDDTRKPNYSFDKEDDSAKPFERSSNRSFDSEIYRPSAGELSDSDFTSKPHKTEISDNRNPKQLHSLAELLNDEENNRPLPRNQMGYVIPPEPNNLRPPPFHRGGWRPIGTESEQPDMAFTNNSRNQPDNDAVVIDLTDINSADRQPSPDEIYDYYLDLINSERPSNTSTTPTSTFIDHVQSYEESEQSLNGHLLLPSTSQRNTTMLEEADTTHRDKVSDGHETNTSIFSKVEYSTLTPTFIDPSDTNIKNQHTTSQKEEESRVWVDGKYVSLDTLIASFNFSDEVKYKYLRSLRFPEWNRRRDGERNSRKISADEKMTSSTTESQTVSSITTFTHSDTDFTESSTTDESATVSFRYAGSENTRSSTIVESSSSSFKDSTTSLSYIEVENTSSSTNVESTTTTPDYSPIGNYNGSINERDSSAASNDSTNSPSHFGMETTSSSENEESSTELETEQHTRQSESTTPTVPSLTTTETNDSRLNRFRNRFINRLVDHTPLMTFPSNASQHNSTTDSGMADSNRPENIVETISSTATNLGTNTVEPYFTGETTTDIVSYHHTPDTLTNSEPVTNSTELDGNSRSGLENEHTTEGNNEELKSTEITTDSSVDQIDTTTMKESGSNSFRVREMSGDSSSEAKETTEVSIVMANEFPGTEEFPVTISATTGIPPVLVFYTNESATTEDQFQQDNRTDETIENTESSTDMMSTVSDKKDENETFEDSELSDNDDDYLNREEKVYFLDDHILHNFATEINTSHSVVMESDEYTERTIEDSGNQRHHATEAAFSLDYMTNTRVHTIS